MEVRLCCVLRRVCGPVCCFMRDRRACLLGLPFLTEIFMVWPRLCHVNDVTADHFSPCKKGQNEPRGEAFHPRCIRSHLLVKLKSLENAPRLGGLLIETIGQYFEIWEHTKAGLLLSSTAVCQNPLKRQASAAQTQRSWKESLIDVVFLWFRNKSPQTLVFVTLLPTCCGTAGRDVPGSVFSAVLHIYNLQEGILGFHQPPPAQNVWAQQLLTSGFSSEAAAAPWTWFRPAGARVHQWPDTQTVLILPGVASF